MLGFFRFFRPPSGRTQGRGAAISWVACFVLANSLALALIAAELLRHAHPPEQLSIAAFVALALVGEASIATLPMALLLIPLALIWPRQPRVWITAGVLAGTATVLIALADVVVYARYRAHINWMVLDLILEGGDDIATFSPASWLLVAFATIVTIVAETGIARVVTVVIVPRTTTRAILAGAAAPMVAFLIAATVHVVADAQYSRSVTYWTEYLPLYRPITAKGTLRRLGWVVPAAARNERVGTLLRPELDDLQLPLRPLTCNAGEPKNLVIVLIDSWRFDLFSPETTPEMHRFAETHSLLRFADHHSGGNATRLGVFSLFYGISGTYWSAMYARQRAPLLMTELECQGYELGIFASARLDIPPLDRTVFANVPQLRMRSAGRTAWQRDRNAVEDWKAWFANVDREGPFFSLLFLDAPHASSFPPDYPRLFESMAETPRRLTPNPDPLPLFNRFRQSVHYVDSLVGEVIATLAEADELENTVILFTGDHGEEFNDNGIGYWGHGGNYTAFQIKVPLLLWWPGKTGVVVEHRTTHLDVAPTLMRDLLACTNPFTDYSNGRHLLDPTPRDGFISGGYFHHAVVEADRQTVMLPTGNYVIRAPDGSPLPDATLRPEIVSQALEETRRFYR